MKGVGWGEGGALIKEGDDDRRHTNFSNGHVTQLHRFHQNDV